MVLLYFPWSLSELAGRLVVEALSGGCAELERLECAGDVEKAEKQTAALASHFARLPEPVLQGLVKDWTDSTFMKPLTFHCARLGLKILLHPCLLEVDFLSFFEETYLIDNGVTASSRLRVSMEAIPVLVNLRHVGLRSLATNEAIRLLCRHCPRLRQLDVSSSSVDDDGLRCLGVTGSMGAHGCSELLSLDVRGCAKVTPVGVAHVLRNLKQLRKLGYEKHFSALDILFDELPAVNGLGESAQLALTQAEDSRVFQLKELVQMVPPFSPTPERMEWLVRSCPFVGSVKIPVGHDGILSEFPRFSNLSSVELSGLNTSAETGFLAFAEGLGERLTVLSIECTHMPRTWLEALGEHCTKLKTFKLTADDADSCSLNDGKHFRSLETLFVSIPKPRGRHVLQMLATNALDLKNLHLGADVWMTDLFWENFLRSIQGLRELEMIRFRSANENFFVVDEHPHVGIRTIDAFIAFCPKLKIISGVRRLGALSKEDFTRLKTYFHTAGVLIMP